MKSEDFRGLDKAVASYLVTPGSSNALAIMREARRIELSCSGISKDLATAHKKDARSLHDATLTLESDPEIVNRNMVARVISGFFPVLNSIEEFRSMEDRGLWDLVISGMGILSEIATSTQYLEATRISTKAHNERALLDIEDRLFYMSGSSGMDLTVTGPIIEGFLDEIRTIDIPIRMRPFVPFILWNMITILSYKQLKDEISGK